MTRRYPNGLLTPELIIQTFDLVPSFADILEIQRELNPNVSEKRVMAMMDMYGHEDIPVPTLVGEHTRLTPFAKVLAVGTDSQGIFNDLFTKLKPGDIIELQPHITFVFINPMYRDMQELKDKQGDQVKRSEVDVLGGYRFQLLKTSAYSQDPFKLVKATNWIHNMFYITPETVRGITSPEWMLEVLS